MSGDGLLTPGAHRAAGTVDDAALVGAMLQVEVAWLRALASVGALDPAHADRVAAVAADWRVDLIALAADSEAAGNVVVPLVRELRSQVGGDSAGFIHRGLTSQDVLDSALMLLARDALVRVRGDLTATARSLATLAAEHRDTVTVGRTLTQFAVPVTFGLKAAQWLAGVLDAGDQVDVALASLPVQCGGAAGTLALVGELTSDPVAAARAFASELSLTWPGAPWHTNRSAVTRTGAALVGVCDALGVLASDVALLTRPEIAEVREGVVAGRGGSSTMPHKRNPVLSVLVRSAALQAPFLGAQLHLAAAQAVDERPDGAWHSEWPALRRLLELTVTAASQSAELVAGLEVDTDAMSSRVEAAAEDLLAEKDGGGKPGDYLGASSAFIDAILARFPETGPSMAEQMLTATRLAGPADAGALLVVGPSLGTSVEELWGAAAARLGETFEVVGWDLPGHGRSKPAVDPFTLADLAAAVRRIAEEVAADRPAFYAGVSLGGGVALELALEPGPFSAVACLAGAASFGDPTAWHDRAALVRRAGTPVMVAGSSQRWFAPGFIEREPGVANRLLLSLSDSDSGSYALACEALAVFDVRERLSTAGVPVLVGPGELDVVIAPDVAAASIADRVPRSSWHVFAGCGHLPPAEDPASVAEVLTATFSRGGDR